MRKWILLVISVLLSACTTTPVLLKDAELTPPDRLLAFQAKEEGKGTITVIRDQGMLGSGCYAGFYLNGTLAGRVDVAEAATFYVEPGEVLMRLGWDPQGRGMCSFGQDIWVQRETLIKSGDSKQFRLKFTQGGEWDILRADPVAGDAARSVSAPGANSKPVSPR